MCHEGERQTIRTLRLFCVCQADSKRKSQWMKNIITLAFWRSLMTTQSQSLLFRGFARARIFRMPSLQQSTIHTVSNHRVR